VVWRYSVFERMGASALVLNIRGPGVVECPVKLRSAVLGNGNTLSSFGPLELIRFAGILLPGNGRPVVGSLITINCPLVSRLCEKSPWRSRAVGTLYCRTDGGALKVRPAGR